MSIETATLRLARVHLYSRSLVALGQSRGFPRQVDTGYLVHCALGEIFGEAAPKPFAIVRERRGAVEVLAYTEREKDALRHQADAFADPSLHPACDWQEFDVKPMPSDWQTGRRLSFNARVCPVIRMPRGCKSYAPGSEVDAFLARCTAVGKDEVVDRKEVYREWFTTHVERLGGARIVRVALQAFQLERLTRRTQGTARKSNVKVRPEATMVGEVEVTDPVAFDNLLRRGIGRHRAFGFGMLLIRRPSG